MVLESATRVTASGANETTGSRVYSDLLESYITVAY
jgi:hypothetical protein